MDYNLNIDNLSNEFNYVVFSDINGKEIQQFSLFNKSKASINTASLSEGIYFVKMVN